MADLFTPEMAGSGQRGICAHCGLGPTAEGHDGCLGTLPTSLVMNACCGHGNDHQAYIQYWDRTDLRGVDAVNEQKRLASKRKVSTKQCPNPECQSTRLRLYRSINKKQCDECLLWFDWNLDEGQEPLIGSSRDRDNSVGNTPTKGNH